MKELKCKSCGAPLNASTMKCEYCGTSYLKESGDDLPKLDKIVKFNHILTPNEARRVMGLDAVPDNAPARLWNAIRESVDYMKTEACESFNEHICGVRDKEAFLSVDGPYEPKNLKYIRESPDICGVYDAVTGERIKTLINT